MELIKVLKGDGPLEIARLKAAMQKAEVKFNEINNYSQDLAELEAQGFLNHVELAQTQKKIQEEKEAYETAKMQFESFVKHVHPIQIKKAKSYIKKMKSNREEVDRNGKYRIEKAQLALNQAYQQLNELKRQLADAEVELAMTLIYAPSSGMVVLKEEYRSSQKRKPRVGDILVRNQPILDLPDLSKMIVKTKVREIDLYKVEIGEPTLLEVDAYPHLTFHGKVSFIGILALNDMTKIGDEKNYEVRISVEDSDNRLRPGMTTRAVILAGKVNDSLAIPIHTVFENNKEHFCYVADGDGYVIKPLKIGKSNENWVQVLAGIQENDNICTAIPPEVAIKRDDSLQ